MPPPGRTVPVPRSFRSRAQHPSRPPEQRTLYRPQGYTAATARRSPSPAPHRSPHTGATTRPHRNLHRIVPGERARRYNCITTPPFGPASPPAFVPGAGICGSDKSKTRSPPAPAPPSGPWPALPASPVPPGGGGVAPKGLPLAWLALLLLLLLFPSRLATKGMSLEGSKGAPAEPLAEGPEERPFTKSGACEGRTCQATARARPARPRHHPHETQAEAHPGAAALASLRTGEASS
jgi:hypothetical protein